MSVFILKSPVWFQCAAKFGNCYSRWFCISKDIPVFSFKRAGESPGRLLKMQVRPTKIFSLGPLAITPCESVGRWEVTFSAGFLSHLDLLKHLHLIQNLSLEFLNILLFMNVMTNLWVFFAYAVPLPRLSTILYPHATQVHTLWQSLNHMHISFSSGLSCITPQHSLQDASVTPNHLGSFLSLL